MEDISDVEFGSDKESEEAPILVAQRYLNIFRQVHIFKKEMRDKFDDELLALPTNVTDFFKKMPGGRLLVEHIEDVKTERGISFVKANREDFTNGTETVADTTSNVTSNVVGGNVVMDASFAETFAKSMADAFKNIPALSANDHPVVSSDQPIVSEYPIDLDKAFEPIVEEIKTLHSSVLNMLNETRSIADNVITSQISISRMLEDSLNSPVQQENILLDDAILKKTEKFISADELDETLSQFKNQLQINFNQSLDEIKSLINTYMEQQTKLQMLPLPKENKEPYPSLSEDISVSDIDASLSDIPVVDASLSDIPMVDEPVSDIPVVGDSELLLDDDLPVSEQLAAVIDEKISDNNDKKKKKKKKKKSKNLGDVETDAISTEALINGDDTYTDIPDDDSVVQGVIHNDFYKHDDDFSYINLDEPPLDTDDSSLADLSTTMLDDLSSIETSNNSEEFNSNAISDGNKSFEWH